MAKPLVKVTQHSRIHGVPTTGGGWAPNFGGSFDSDANAMTKLFTAIDERVYVASSIDCVQYLAYSEWAALKSFLTTYGMRWVRIADGEVFDIFINTVIRLSHAFWDTFGNQPWNIRIEDVTVLGPRPNPAQYGRVKAADFNYLVDAIGLFDKIYVPASAIGEISRRQYKQSKTTHSTRVAAYQDAWGGLGSWGAGSAMGVGRYAQTTGSSPNYTGFANIQRNGHNTYAGGTSAVQNFTIQDLKLHYSTTARSFTLSQGNENTTVLVYHLTTGAVTNSDVETPLGALIGSFSYDIDEVSQHHYESLATSGFSLTNPSANGYVFKATETEPSWNEAWHEYYSDWDDNFGNRSFVMEFDWEYE